MPHQMVCRHLATLALAVALAACGGEPQQEAPAAPAAAAIPARFLGVWDAEFGSCDPESELRLRIAANGIGFIESYGTITRLTEAASGKVTLDLAMEGEAETWDTTFILETTGRGEGERLLVLEPPDGPHSEIMLQPVRFKRCPA